ncbi:polyprenol reductase isoform X2 [Bombina bombina]|uniref:polyprenol reductase isoform X2 n=1 Tax=Bombina bombina TaxID=8345 RepID=UPI00235B17C8|nr:polyprenol reductase isoform X2 [Bombina bombina]
MQLSVPAGVNVISLLWVLLDAAFLTAFLLYLFLDSSRQSFLYSLFQDVIRYGKTKVGLQRPVWLHYFDVPKRWFSHFYYVSVIWNGSLLWFFLRALLLGHPVPDWLRLLLYYLNVHPKEHILGGELSVVLALTLVWLLSVRRLMECVFVSVFSDGVMHLVQYCFGLGYYLLIGVTIISQCSLSNTGTVITMNYAVPSGDWFDKVSCPHYFAELLIYISIAIVLGIWSTTWWLVVIYVLFSQALAAALCHEFYHEKFDSYPVQRKAFIPFVF